MVDSFADMKLDSEIYPWTNRLFGHSFSLSRTSYPERVEIGPAKSIMQTMTTWLRCHEEAQQGIFRSYGVDSTKVRAKRGYMKSDGDFLVMLASLLVVVGIWWLVRALLALVINIICPLVLVLLAVISVPQLRQPLLGQNYPAVANFLRSILLKVADALKSST